MDDTGGPAQEILAVIQEKDDENDFPEDDRGKRSSNSGAGAGLERPEDIQVVNHRM